MTPTRIDDIQSHNAARLMAFVRDVEARHIPSKTKLLETWTLSGFQTVEVSSCDACHMPWPCPDRRALDRLNGGA